MALSRKQIKTDGLAGVNGIVNPYRNGNQRELDVPFPNRPHKK
jgi:hypothetical protein